MKERINMTFDPEFIEKHVEYLQISGLNRSQYFNQIIASDVKRLNQITSNKELSFNEIREKVKEHFNSKIGKGGQIADNNKF